MVCQGKPRDRAFTISLGSGSIVRRHHCVVIGLGLKIRCSGRDLLAVQKYPREYAPLAYLLEKSGFPVNRVYPTKG
jgi:hypothetical protein